MRLIFITGLFLFALTFGAASQSLTATEIITKADNLQRGKSSKSVFLMKIIRPKWTREIKMRNWSLGRDYSMTYILSPPKDKGQVFLKQKMRCGTGFQPSAG